MLVFILVVAAIAVLAFYFIPPVNKWFRDSETLLFSWLQGLIVVPEVIAQVDPGIMGPILPDGWLPYYLVGVAVLTNVLRRVRATDL